MIINEARTLLLNQSGADQPAPSFYLQELVPEDFRPIELPSYLQRIYDVLFGTDPDQAFLNFRTWQYMHILHSTDFAFYVFSLDPRVTYLNKRSIVDAQYLPVVTPMNALSQDFPVYVQGLPGVSSSGQLLFQWNIKITNGLVVKTTELRTNKSLETIVTITNNLTSPIALIGQRDMSIQIGSSAPLAVGALWQLQTLGKPNYDIVNVVEQLKIIGDENIFQLFGSRTVGPYNVFRQLWEKEADIHYALSGFLLAYIYRVNEVRRGG